MKCDPIPTLFQRPDRITEPLYVVTPIYNPVRFRSRWKLYEDFAKHVAEAGGVLHTVEVAFGDREFSITQPDNPRHLQLRTSSELWLKESAINVAVSRLPADWQYVAWVDADVLFSRQDWADEARHLLQHHPIVQLWSEYLNLTPEHEIGGKTTKSFARCYVKNELPPRISATSADYDGYYGSRRGYPGAPGLAWAATRQAWDTLGGLLDVCIVGAGDWYMAHGLIGQLSRKTVRGAYSAGYRRALLDWQDRASALKGDIGYVPGLALHYWHGPKANRGYRTRDQILIDHGFDPRTDLRRDWQGLWQFTDRVPGLRRDVRAYFKARNEDAV